MRRDNAKVYKRFDSFYREHDNDTDMVSTNLHSDLKSTKWANRVLQLVFKFQHQTQLIYWKPKVVMAASLAANEFTIITTSSAAIDGKGGIMITLGFRGYDILQNVITRPECC